MSEIWLGVAFFGFVMTAVVISGYFFMQRIGGRRTELPAGLTAEPALPPSRAVFFDLFRSIGENFPAAKDERNPYRVRLASAGYRWPSALPVFYGIKCGSALFVAGLLGTGTLIYRGQASATLVPMICGLGFGFLLPDRVLTSRILARRQRLRSAVPAALDLMVGNRWINPLPMPAAA